MSITVALYKQLMGLENLGQLGLEALLIFLEFYDPELVFRVRGLNAIQGDAEFAAAIVNAANAFPGEETRKSTLYQELIWQLQTELSITEREAKNRIGGTLNAINLYGLVIGEPGAAQRAMLEIFAKAHGLENLHYLETTLQIPSPQRLVVLVDGKFFAISYDEQSMVEDMELIIHLGNGAEISVPVNKHVQALIRG